MREAKAEILAPLEQATAGHGAKPPPLMVGAPTARARAPSRDQRVGGYPGVYGCHLIVGDGRRLSFAHTRADFRDPKGWGPSRARGRTRKAGWASRWAGIVGVLLGYMTHTRLPDRSLVYEKGIWRQAVELVDWPWIALSFVYGVVPSSCLVRGRVGLARVDHFLFLRGSHIFAVRGCTIPVCRCKLHIRKSASARRCGMRFCQGNGP